MEIEKESRVNELLRGTEDRSLIGTFYFILEFLVTFYIFHVEEIEMIDFGIILFF